MKMNIFSFPAIAYILLLNPSAVLGQWMPAPIPPTYVGAMISNGDDVYVGTDSAVYLSVDGGITWSHPSNTGMRSYEIVYSLTVKDSFLFAATAFAGVYRSVNHAKSWIAVNNGLPPYLYTYSLAVCDSGILAGTYKGIFLSTDDGNSWQPRNVGMANKYVWEIAVGPNRAGGWNVLAGASGGGGAFLSTNRGVTWKPVSHGWADSSIWALAVGIDSSIFVGTEKAGVYHSVDEGATWQQRKNGLTSLSVQGLVVIPDGFGGQYVLAGTDGGGVFVTTDNGENWRAANSGLSLRHVNALAANADFVFAGFMSDGVWVRSLVDILASTEQGVGMAPIRYVLKQNYPNPFNPLTTIEFELPARSFVTLRVFDLLGREVAWLANRQILGAGTHRLALDGGSLSSGVYLYELVARGSEAKVFRQVKKMALVK